MGYPWYADDPEQITLLKSMGVTYIRDDIRWNIIEKKMVHIITQNLINGLIKHMRMVLV